MAGRLSVRRQEPGVVVIDLEAAPRSDHDPADVVFPEDLDHLRSEGHVRYVTYSSSLRN